MSTTMQIALKSNSKLFSLAVVSCSIVSAVPATTQTYLCWYVSDFLINCKGSSHTKLLPEFFQRHEWWGSGGKWWRHATLGWVNRRNYILLVYFFLVIYVIVPIYQKLSWVFCRITHGYLCCLHLWPRLSEIRGKWVILIHESYTHGYSCGSVIYYPWVNMTRDGPYCYLGSKKLIYNNNIMLVMSLMIFLSFIV
jgi:hypothetical protein